MAKLAANTVEGRAQPYLERIERLLDEIASERGSFMNKCGQLREDIKEIYTEAKGNDIAVKALRGLVKWRELEKKQNAIAEGLDIDESAAYSALISALGPLGQAAADRAGYKAEDGDDVRSRAQKQRESDREAEQQIGRGPVAPATH